MGTPAGKPVRIATRHSPCDSPAVSNRSIYKEVTSYRIEWDSGKFSAKNASVSLRIMRILYGEMSLMLPNFLIPETVIREAGSGPELGVGSMTGGLLLLTLGITRIIEQESLDISILGSSDNAEWSAKPIVSFPQKFYCGTYQLILDLSQHSDIKYLRAKWQVSRWGRGDPKPLFGVYLFAQDANKQTAAIAKTA